MCIRDSRKAGIERFKNMDVGHVHEHAAAGFVFELVERGFEVQRPKICTGQFERIEGVCVFFGIYERSADDLEGAGRPPAF